MNRSTLVVMVLCAAALGQPETFRSLSTAGMIQDDLDRWHLGMLHLQPVPDKLLTVEGIRLYTGLSNLATGADRLFEESEEENRGGFLLGASWAPVEASWGMGLLAEFLEDRIYDELVLLGPDGEPYVTGAGQVEGSWSEFVDTNGDGVLDARRTVHEAAVARTDTSAVSAGLYGALRVSEAVNLGLGVSMHNTHREALGGDDNHSISISDTNLVTGTQTYLLESVAEGSEEMSTSGLLFSLSGTGEVTDMLDLGGMFQYADLSGEVTIASQFSGTEDFLPEEAEVYDRTDWSGSEHAEVSPSGNRLGGGLNLEYRFDENWTLTSSGGYYMDNVSGSSDLYSLAMDSLRLVTVGSLIDTTHITVDGSGSSQFDLETDLASAGFKLTFDPSDAMTISLGLGAYMHQESQTSTNQAQIVRVETYSDGDDQFADPDDYVSTATWSQTEEHRTTLETTRVSVPIGLEFQVLPKLHLRLGASPGFVWRNEIQTTTLLEASPMTVHTVYGDGTEEQYVETPYQTPDGTLIETDETYTDIRYAYGLGYSPNDHIRMDLMGFGNHFDRWRLSATLLF